jgi:signal transduction histidine kinase
MALLNEQVWLGTRNDGLFRLGWRDGTVDSLLSDRRVFSLSTAGDSLVLAGTNDGLYLLGAETGAIHRRLTTADGLLSNTAAGQLVGDTLYVRHPYGTTTLPRSIALSSPRPPNPTITGLSVHGESRPPVDSARLAVDERTLTFRFSGVHLARGTDVRHTYRLASYDTTWQSTTDRRVRYTDLPPGSYTFQVRATLTDTPVGGPASLHVSLPPAYYETTWFWWLCGLAGLGLLAGAYGLRVRALRRRQEELQALVAERTRRLAAEKEKTQEQAERLAALDDEKNRFFANISHELRTPLTLLIGTLKEALDGVFGDPPPPLRQQLEIMQKHLGRIQRLADQLLDLSRLEATDPGLEPEPCDLAAFVRDLTQAFAPLADRRGIELGFDAAPDAHPCRFDPEKLETLFDNLLSNALKFTLEGGAVAVRLDVEPPAEADAPPTAVVEVEDTGPGVPEDQQDPIFERFSLSQSQDSDAAGTGLGLALAHEFAEMHGGTIDLDSTPGRGSTFAVRLPLPVVEADAVDDPTEDDVIASVPATPSGNGESTLDESVTDAPAPESDRPVLLVAEDNADVRAYLQRHLGDHWTVAEAVDGAEALDTARQMEPDLVVADVMVPELDGLALTRPSARTTPWTAFPFCSSPPGPARRMRWRA